MDKPAKKLSKSKLKKPVPTCSEAEGVNKPGPIENEDLAKTTSEAMDKNTENTKQVPESPAKSATSSPVKKRARLSLKGNKSVQKLSSFFGPDASPREGNMAPNINGNSSGVKCDRSENIALYGKPCVASLHNLGNTCFLNSVLQVLRHTPGFLSMLSGLSEEVAKTESLQDLIVTETTSKDDDEEIMTWTLVHALNEVFQKMKLAEEKYKSKTSHYLSVRPYDMMSAIERLNPMFEGNMQHDVHELLRCILAYMEDAVRELNKVRSNYHERYLGDDASVTLKSQETESLDVKVEQEEEEEEERENEVFDEVEDTKSSVKDVKSSVKDATTAKNESQVDNGAGDQGPAAKQPAKKNRLTMAKIKKEEEKTSSSTKAKKTAAKQEIKSPQKSVKVESCGETSGTKTANTNATKSGVKSTSAKAKVPKTPRSANKEKTEAKQGKKTNGKNSEKGVKKKRKTPLKTGANQSSVKEEDSQMSEIENDTDKPVTKTNPRKLPRKLTNQAGQKKLNGFLSSVRKTENIEDVGKSVEASKSPKAPVANGHVANGKASKGPSTPRKKQNGLTVKVNGSSPHKNAYKTPEKPNITLTASSPVTAKHIFAKHKMNSEDDNPASGDTPVVVGVDVTETGDNATEDSQFKAALHSPTQVVNGDTGSVTVNGAKGSPSNSASTLGAIKKSRRGRVVKCTPKAAALVAKASKKRKLSNEESVDSESDTASLKSPSSRPSKPGGKSRKSPESANANGKVNGKENAKVVNGRPSVDPKQMNVLSMLKNPVPRKRLGVRGSLVRKPSKDDVSASDTSLTLSDQVDGCCDDPHIKDREPFEDNPPDIVQEILNSGAQGTYMPVYFSSDESEMDDIDDSHDDTPGDLINDDVSDLLPPDDTISYDSFDITDSSDTDSDEDFNSENSDISDTDDVDTKDEADKILIPSELGCVNSKDTGDKRAFSASPDSTSSHGSIKLLQKKLRRTETVDFNLGACSGDSDGEQDETLPQLDGVFDDWKIPRLKQTARKSCPQDRATVPAAKPNGHEEDDSEIRRSEEIQEAVAQGHQAFVKLSMSAVPCYLQQQVLATLQSQVKEQGDVSDSVKRTFEGDMALRTRCLECENFTERKEAYQDISLAVKKDGCHDDSDDEDKSGNDGESSSKDELEWLRSALADVESLNGDNKYFCDRCHRLTEAQRSMHYVTLPKVLTLHLKRFAATNGFFGGLTKINDHVPTPLELPCIQDNCVKNCSDPAHRYTLYGVITHTGISIGSGHYIAYVKVTDRNLWRDVEPVSDDEECMSNGNGNGNNSTIPMQTEDGLADPNNNADTNNNLDANDIMPNQNTLSSNMDENSAAETAVTNNADVTRWLECDDDKIRVLSNSEFEDILSNSGAGTPYMLFYHTVLDQFESMQV